ncbi:MAG: NlpC/P60 family protein [Flavobacteriales bacterium]|nr:NlpC/P60 family protein [Flavobacteriales bacterium]
MKKTLLFISAMAVSYFTMAQNITDSISSIKARFAPDGRSTVYNIAATESNGTLILTGETSVPQAKEALLKAANAVNKNVADYITVLPDEKSLNGKIYGVISLSVADLRMKNAHSSEQGSQILMGMPVKILKKDGWYLTQTVEGYTGWIPTASVVPMTKDEYNAYVKAKKVIFLQESGHIYSQPNASADRVSDVVAGNIMKYEGAKGKWTKVSLADGRTAYVESAKVTDFATWAKNTRPTQQSVISFAKTLMGVPYHWGATSVKLLDCSGFAKTVYYMNGLVLARDASQQCLTGDKIEIDDIATQYDRLQTGDLVFWGRKATATSKERVTHVGIYIGDGLFIHESGRVRLDSFNKNDKEHYSQNYVNIFVRASRIIGTQDQDKGVTSVEKNPLFNIQK